MADAVAQPMAGIAVFLINLDRSVKRRADMTARLAALGLSYTWFRAVDGVEEWSSLIQHLDEPAFRRNTGRSVLAGDVGCYHSHLRVWQTFLATNADTALVLEDDVVFHDDFIDALAKALAARDKWDMVKLNCIRAQHPFRQIGVGRYRMTSYIGTFTGTGAYLITRDLAARLLPSMLPITRPIDHELDPVFVHKFRHFGLEPFPSHVDDGNESTITGTGFSEVKKFPKWKRLPNYALRVRNLIGKAAFLLGARGG
jgi:glycosyl transferase family 25